MSIQTIFSSKIVKYFVAGLTLFISIGLVRTLYHSLQLTKVPEGNQEVISQLEAEKKSIEDQLEASQHPFAQEKIIRDELNMAQPGERIIQLPPLEEPSPSPTPTPTPAQAPWQQWRDLIL